MIDPNNPSEHLDVEAAIWEKNIEVFRKALEAGWKPIVIGGSDSGFQNNLKITRIISLNWQEGWDLLIQKFPQILKDEIFLKLSIKMGGSHFFESFLAYGYFSPDYKIVSDFGESFTLTEFVIRESSRIGDVGYPVSDDVFYPLFESLLKRGANLLAPVQGGDDKKKTSPKGYCAWSFAIKSNRLDLAEKLLPSTWREIESSPRGMEVLFDFAKEFKNKKNYISREDVKNNEYSISSFVSIHDKYRIDFWIKFLNKHIIQWLTISPPQDIGDIVDNDFLFFINPEARKAIWHFWVLSTSEGWGPFHELAKTPLHVTTINTMRLMIEDKAEVLTLWKWIPDGEGVSPSVVWALEGFFDVSEEERKESVYLTVDEAIQEILTKYPSLEDDE